MGWYETEVTLPEWMEGTSAARAFDFKSQIRRPPSEWPVQHVEPPVRGAERQLKLLGCF